MRETIVALACGLALMAPMSGAAAPKEATPAEACTWGASSMTAEVSDDGRWVESEPQTSGCIPPP